jgi:hypothetical protein
MSGNTIYRGLCSTCKHASTCTFPRDPQRPAFYCEEFEIEIPSSGKTAGDERLRLTESSVTELKGSSMLIGLCSDCENRQTCVFPKPEGGVWRCEEYR